MILAYMLSGSVVSISSWFGGGLLIGAILIVWQTPAPQRPTWRRVSSAALLAFVFCASALYAMPLQDACSILEPGSWAFFWMGCWW